MTNWIRFTHDDQTKIGQLDDGTVQCYQGDMFGTNESTGETLRLEEIEPGYPCEPRNFLGLWNNFYSRAEKEGWDVPPEPLYFSKLASSYSPPGKKIVRPVDYDGPVYFEAELGIVIGKTCKQITEQQSAEHIFGYTCVNDVTALEVLGRDKSFPQWVRSKSYDSFCPFGPVINTDVDLDSLIIRAVLDGETRQEYRVSDMVFPPHRLVSILSHYMTLLPGDVIACGTASGSGPMQDGQVIDIEIDGIGKLTSTMQG